MRLPTKDEIATAIEDANNLTIPLLQGYLPCEGILGPESYAGGFCIVFPFTDGHDTKAVRIWHQEIDKVRERYNILSKDFSSASSPYLCNLRYYTSSLKINTESVDVVVMDWVNGQTLKTFLKDVISRNKQANIVIEDLAKDFYNMCLDLHKLGFSHGDLQHDNIIVTEHGRLKLVDYDSFYTPSMGVDAFYQTTTGYNGYQHPDRFINKYYSNSKTDYFSELIIYLSLKALSKNLALWTYAEDADYSFLFTAQDFQDLTSCSLYTELEGMDEEIQVLLKILNKYLSCDDINKLESFDTLLVKYMSAPVITSFATDCSGILYNGQSTKICWEVENATRILLNDKDVTHYSNCKIKAQNGQTFTLYASNGYKESVSRLQIESVPEPLITLKLDKKKIRKGKDDKVAVKWNVTNGYEVRLCTPHTILANKTNGRIDTSVKQTTTFTLDVIGLDRKKHFQKTATVYVLDESDSSFVSDRQFSYPGIPVTLSWNVKHSKHIELVGFGEVQSTGQLTVEPSVTTCYQLKVSDAFGTKVHSLTIQMLPLPYVKQLLVPSPKFETPIQINTITPTPNFNISFPNIKIMGVELTPPRVPDLKECGIAVKLSSRIENQIKLWVDIKHLYHYYRKRILNHGEE